MSITARILAKLGVKGSEYNPVAIALEEHQEQRASIVNELREQLDRRADDLVDMTGEWGVIGKLLRGRVSIHMENQARFLNLNSKNSVQIAIDEMERDPELFERYQKFHETFDKVKRCQASIEDCLQSIKYGDVGLKAEHDALKKEYAAFKKTSKYDDLLATYNKYNTAVERTIEVCSKPAPKASL